VQIDWFTFFAEIINFLVLMVLLKRFLYGPIFKVMEQRERKIAANLQEAAEKTQQAQQEADLYRQKQQELEEQREAMFSQMKAEVAQVREDLIKNARAEVDATQARWNQALQQEKDLFVQQMRLQISQQICATARSALMDLANTDLEEHIIQVFMNRLQTLDAEQREMLCRSVTSNEVVVSSAFDIPNAMRTRIEKVVWEQIAHDTNVQFETLSEIICGIELRTDSYKLSWSVESYLATLEESLSRVIEEELGK
jgi:F-type H+-transporting ATPase subunit b